MRKIAFWTVTAVGFLVGVFQIGFTQGIVTIGPTSSSIVTALGVKIIASDSESVQTLQKSDGQTVLDIGYMRALTIESLLSVNPSLVIADSAASPSSVIKRLQDFNIQVVSLVQAENLVDIEKNIQLIAQKFHKTKEVEVLIARLKAQNNEAKVIVGDYINKHNSSPRKVLMLLQISANGIYMLGQHTQSDRWLHLIDAKNILSFSGMRPASKEGLMSLAPDVIIIAQSSMQMTLPYQTVLKYLHDKYGTKVNTIEASRIDNFGAESGQTQWLLARKVYLNETSTVNLSAY